MGNKNIYERFLWFDDRVRRKKFPNATALAREFEISTKTAQRDIEFMRDRLNCPVLYDKARKGYYYEDETFSLPLMYLSSSELSSLLVAQRLLRDVSGSCLADDITSAVDKITSIIEKHTAKPDALNEVMSFHLMKYSPVPEETFRIVLESCLKRKTMAFTYHSPVRAEKTERSVDPYHLMNYMGTWHVIGYCHLRSGVRDFNVNRITAARVSSEPFDMPANFSFNDYFHSSFGLYKGKSLKQVTLRFTAEKAKWVRDQVWHKDQDVKYLDDGSLELSLPVAGFSELAGEILRHGSGVEVLKPESLRNLLKEELIKISQIYQ